MKITAIIWLLMFGPADRQDHQGIQNAFSTPEACMEAKTWWENRKGPDKAHWDCYGFQIFDHNPHGPPKP